MKKDTAAARAGVMRTTEDQLGQRFTAKDLLGKAVHDSAGEKIGDITDLDLSGLLPSSIAKSFAEQPDTMTKIANTVGLGESKGSVIISVGGVMGMGAELVTVPASELSFDAAKQRFQLAVTKADVVAIANDKMAGGEGAAMAKQSFNDEATRVQKLLESSAGLADIADDITVAASAEGIELRGTVASEDQRRLIVDTARKATGIPVKDSITVSK